ncbi:MAG: 2-C-methyl-D-erythritol 4-phosphate cytidylyltransferase [Chlorobi bacterium]|nr:2-C-methyl-D-erythritol 4-phosphate cytidylyltransferase [Chlorobiota bacterium]
MDYYILITAAGKGQRIGGKPKQFVELSGIPLLMHTFNAFAFLRYTANFILVLPENDISYWKDLCLQFSFDTPHEIISGGPKRFYSVKRGLNLVPDNAIVAIHDGVRPLVSQDTIQRCFTLAERKGNAVPAITVHESVRETDGALNKPVDRKKLRTIQTPQVFYSNLIKKAYHQNYREDFTDDVSVLESIGQQVYLTEGNDENIKITTPADLIMAEALLKWKEER